MKYEELARRWWINQDLFSRGAPEEEFPSDWNDTEVEVNELSWDPQTLAPLVEAIVAVAPGGDHELSYVGTAVLETSSFELGRQTLEIFAGSAVPADKQRQVLKGFAHPLDD